MVQKAFFISQSFGFHFLINCNLMYSPLAHAPMAALHYTPRVPHCLAMFPSSTPHPRLLLPFLIVQDQCRCRQLALSVIQIQPAGEPFFLGSGAWRDLFVYFTDLESACLGSLMSLFQSLGFINFSLSKPWVHYLESSCLGSLISLFQSLGFIIFSLSKPWVHLDMAQRDTSAHAPWQMSSAAYGQCCYF